MKHNDKPLTEAEKLEQTRERNRRKQAALRERRAKRLAELEAENAKLASIAGTTPLPIPKKGARSKKSGSPSEQQPIASTSGTSGGSAGAYGRGSATTSRSDEEVSRLHGAVGRLVSRLKDLGVGDAEIGRLIAGSSERTGTRPLPRVGPSSAASPSYSPLLSPTSHAQTSLQLPRLQSSTNSPPISHPYVPVPTSSVREEQPVFPFAFLFSDNNDLAPATHRPIPTFQHNLNASSTSSPLTPPPFDSTPVTPSELLPPTSSLSRPTPPTTQSEDVLMRDQSSPPLSEAGPGLLHQLADLATLSGSSKQPQPAFREDIPLKKQISAEWQKKLFDVQSRYVAGLRAGKEVEREQTVSEEIISSTQLYILRFLGETSTQRSLYDGRRSLSSDDQAYLHSGRVDKRVQNLPDPLVRLNLAKAAEAGHLNTTVFISDLLDEVKIYGDVWDVTSWKLPSCFTSRYPSFYPPPFDSASNNSLPTPRPIPSYLRGASVADIVLASEAPTARENGPYLSSYPHDESGRV